MKRLFGRFALVGLALIGGYGIHTANNWAATRYIRTHDNVLSRVEQSLLACNRYRQNKLPYWTCIDAAWSADKASRDALLADCGIRMNGDFTIATGFPPSHGFRGGIPLGYRVPLSFFVSDCRERTAWYAKSVDTAGLATEQLPDTPDNSIHPGLKRQKSRNKPGTVVT